MEDSDGGGIVESALTGGVRASGHEKSSISEIGIGFEKNVGGLAGAEQYDVGLERLDVGSIGVDDGEGVVGDAEEELIVECSVDQSEQVSLPWLHL